MKRFITGLLLMPLFVTAQKPTPQFFDIDWKACDAGMGCDVAIVKKTDSGWLRTDYYLSIIIYKWPDCLQTVPARLKTAGSIYFFTPDGKLSSYGKYAQGKSRASNWGITAMV